MQRDEQGHILPQSSRDRRRAAMKQTLMLKISVKDNGVGMSPEKKQNLFDILQATQVNKLT